jgi:excisionase family DNA binding protein
MTDVPHKYLTTRELADLLRIKERKVYELAADGEVPCSRAMGKLLFPRDQVDAWLAANSSGSPVAVGASRPAVMLGSHDPLLDWAMRESRCGLAAYFDSSLDGLTRFANNAGIAAGLHIPDASGEGWNVQAVKASTPGEAVVLIEWATRQRGLITPADNAAGLESLSDLKGRKMAARQPEAGSQVLLHKLLAEAGIEASDIDWQGPVRSETDAAAMVQEGAADAAFGLACVAAQHRLSFVAVAHERYDLLVDRRAWFEPPMQTLIGFCRSAQFASRANVMQGYDVSNQFQVHYNA